MTEKEKLEHYGKTIKCSKGMYGEELNYIHAKFGRLRKRCNFTSQFIKEHPEFFKAYCSFWDNEDGAFGKADEDPHIVSLRIADYLARQDWGMSVQPYYNFIDEKATSWKDVMNYIISESNGAITEVDKQINFESDEDMIFH